MQNQNQNQNLGATIEWIMAYEGGYLGPRVTLEGFAGLIASGSAWTLQGRYGRTAQALIDAGLISSQGVVTPAGEARLAQAEE
jgi:hypothetical protein